MKGSNLYIQAQKILSTLGNFIFRVVRAWWYFLAGKNRDLMERRLAICETCPFRKWVFCDDCGCELHAKGSDPEEKCPQNKWPKELGMRITQKTW